MQQFFHPQDSSTPILFFNRIKPFTSKAADSGELACKEGERGQLSPQLPLHVVSQMVAALCGLRKLWRKSRAGPPRRMTQGYSNDLNCVFLYYVNYLTRGDKKSVFSLSKREYQVCQGILLLPVSTSGVNTLDSKKPKKLFESKGNAMLACKQMGIDYPCVKFRQKIARKFPTARAGWPWDSLPARVEDKSAQLISKLCSACLSTVLGGPTTT